MYLLDTNHCSRILQGHPVLVQKLSELQDAPISTCVIVRGELIFMAEKSARQRENLESVEQFLADVVVYPIDDETATIYGQLKALILNHFGPKEKAKRRNVTTIKLGFTENDLWIAATAKRHGLIVVSADHDFERIKEVDDLAVESWI